MSLRLLPSRRQNTQQGSSLLGVIAAGAVLLTVGMALNSYFSQNLRAQRANLDRSADLYTDLMRAQINSLIRAGITTDKVWTAEWQRLRPANSPSFAMLPLIPLTIIQILSELSAFPPTTKSLPLIRGLLTRTLWSISRFSRTTPFDQAQPFPLGMVFTTKLEGQAETFAQLNVYGIFSISRVDLADANHRVVDATEAVDSAGYSVNYTIVWWPRSRDRRANGGQIHGTAFRFVIPIHRTIEETLGI